MMTITVRIAMMIAFAIIVAAIAYTQDATLIGFFLIAATAVFALVSATWRCRHCGHAW
jgi:hypothetical protein